MGASLDLTGQQFARLTVIERAPKIGNVTAWYCRCACGTIATVRTGGLRSGLTRSCGCYKREATSRIRRTHGLSGSPTFSTWRGMMERCSNPRHVAAGRYMSRGIEVCKRWHTFANFVADVGERPEGTSLDRIDNARGYEPGNCRWATSTEQSRNRAFCRLTLNLVREIHGRVEHGESKASVARRMRLGETTIRNIIAGRSWRDVYMENQ